MNLVLAILAMLATIAVILVAVVVLVSFGISRQTHADAADERFTALPVGLMLREFTVLLLTLLLRPLGWLPPRVGTGRDDKPPVLLLHGLFQNRGCLLVLQWRLRRAGYRTMSINTPPWHNLATLMARVAKGVDDLRAATGADRVHLVGHSMGGLLARSYLQDCGADRVASCVTLAAPHAGSRLAVFAITKLGRALLPGSPLLTKLNAAPGKGRTTAIYSRDDNIVVPAEYARLEGATNIEMSGIGHTTMLFSGEVAEVVARALAPFDGPL